MFAQYITIDAAARRAKAERLAILNRIDNVDSIVRVRL
jgi:hypothetical protein